MKIAKPTHSTTHNTLPTYIFCILSVIIYIFEKLIWVNNIFYRLILLCGISRSRRVTLLYPFIKNVTLRKANTRLECVLCQQRHPIHHNSPVILVGSRSRPRSCMSFLFTFTIHTLLCNTYLHVSYIVRIHNIVKAHKRAFIKHIKEISVTC